MEHVVLGLGAAGEEGAKVAVDLWPHHKSHLGIPEVAEHARGEIRQRNVVGVDRHDNVVGPAMGGQPRVVVTVLGPGAKSPLRRVPLRHAVAGEMVDSDFRAHRPDRRIIPFVEQPDVNRRAISNLSGRDQCVTYDIDWFLCRHDRRGEGDPQACRRPDRYRIAHDTRGPAERDRIEQPDTLGKDDHQEHDGVAEPDRGRQVRALGKVIRLDQPHEEQRR